MIFLAWKTGNAKGLHMLRRMERSLVDLCDLIYWSVILRLLGMYMRFDDERVVDDAKLCLE